MKMNDKISSLKITLSKAIEYYQKGGELKKLALSAFSEEELKGDFLPKTWEVFYRYDQ